MTDGQTASTGPGVPSVNHIFTSGVIQTIGISVNAPSAPTQITGQQAFTRIIAGKYTGNQGSVQSLSKKTVPVLTLRGTTSSNNNTNAAGEPFFMVSFVNQFSTSNTDLTDVALQSVPEAGVLQSTAANVPVLSIGGSPSHFFIMNDSGDYDAVGNPGQRASAIQTRGDFRITKVGTQAATGHVFQLQKLGPNNGSPTVDNGIMHIESRPTPPSPTSFYMRFTQNLNAAGSISSASGTSVTYSTSSDYRLKKDVAPIENSRSIIEALLPRVWKWKTDDQPGMGFIAHEVTDVLPDNFGKGVVCGEKDEVTKFGKLVDANGVVQGWTEGDVLYPTYVPEPRAQEEIDANIEKGLTWVHEPSEDKVQYQSIDSSFLVAPLVGAVKELSAALNELESRMTQYESRLAAMEAKG